MGDNASNVDSAIKELIRELHLNESKIKRRLRCCGYIINLAVKAFLLGADFKTFIDEIEAAEAATARDE